MSISEDLTKFFSKTEFFHLNDVNVIRVGWVKGVREVHYAFFKVRKRKRTKKTNKKV